MFSLLAPLTAFAAVDGKSHFKEGMRFESEERWDKAAEEFALALNSNPKNPEYKLHLQRAMFNASQMFIKKGTIAAQEKDYEGAYNSFRRAYAFDPTNELAKSEMERMVRLQQGVVNGKENPNTAIPAGPPSGPGVDAAEQLVEHRAAGIGHLLLVIEPRRLLVVDPFQRHARNVRTEDKLREPASRPAGEDSQVIV